MSQSVSQSVSLSVSQSLSQSVNRSVDHLGNYSVNQTVNQSISQLASYSVGQCFCSDIRHSQQSISPIRFLFLKLPPPPCAVLLVLRFVYPRCGSNPYSRSSCKLVRGISKSPITQRFLGIYFRSV